MFLGSTVTERYQEYYYLTQSYYALKIYKLIKHLEVTIIFS